MTLLLAGAHLPYPHTNGFHADGERLVLTRYAPATGATGLVSICWRGEDRATRLLYEASPSTTGAEQMLWPDVALAAERVAWVRNGALHILDLDSGAPERLYTAAPGHTLQNLCSLTASGDRVVVMEHPEGREAPVTCLEVSVATGRAVELFGRGWFANHPAHSPHDEAWLTFAHEGPAREVPDRMWARHPAQVPEGRCVFEQATERGTLAVGHERWMFHDLGAVVCAYGESEAGPRGLYAVHPDGRAPRLVSAGDRDWHCDISRDGRRAVVDTSGPFDAPGRGWQNAGQVSDVVLVDIATGARTPLARTAADRHPRHPHPVFTPDGTAVLHNHGDPSTGEVAVARVPVPPAVS
ncbi:oligogalacturonate lyase family protein [Streptomyces sp. JV185]|uniref:oligogalacturonate lyase family protein n=1 Tax=Streptomyces sp. JV185 TaxID=858638 RepID=UPI002E78BC99|nr:oligogalacturonate lyase family protein [Streptomyces sp. JV185]MEE1770914.1 oligogalacturonate lyase family protein [Streptomyces sp. JV185]